MKPLIKKIIATGLVLASLYGCERFCEKQEAKFEKLPYADATPEIRSIKYMQHHTFNGLYLTLEESIKKEDNDRTIVFYDYGFDGKLDRVKISQKERKPLIVTNLTELVKWQPLFEKMRQRRFGEYKLEDGDI